MVSMATSSKLSNISRKSFQTHIGVNAIAHTFTNTKSIQTSRFVVMIEKERIGVKYIANAGVVCREILQRAVLLVCAPLESPA